MTNTKGMIFVMGIFVTLVIGITPMMICSIANFEFEAFLLTLVITLVSAILVSLYEAVLGIE